MISTLIRKSRMPAASEKQLAFLRQASKNRRVVLRRDGFKCRHCGIKLGDRLDIHHVVKRSHAPKLKLDLDNLVSLCRICHAWTDSPFSSARGRLVVTARGDGRFAFEIVKKNDKWTPPAA